MSLKNILVLISQVFYLPLFSFGLRVLREGPLVLVTNHPKLREIVAKVTVVAFLSSCWGFTWWGLYISGENLSSNRHGKTLGVVGDSQS